MSTLGDVVFCVDCDRVRLSRLQPAAAGSAGSQVVPARRMATKKDANGDPLCATCLDARQAGRRAEFVMLHEARASAASQPSAAVAAARTPRQRIEFVHIVRSSPVQADPGVAPRKKAATRKAAAKVGPRPSKTTANGRRKKGAARKVAAQPASRTGKKTAKSRGLERQFAMLVIEIGFPRAQQLLDELKKRAQRTRRAKRATR